MKKRKVPSQAFWNKMDVMPVPQELKNLSDTERYRITLEKIVIF